MARQNAQRGNPSPYSVAACLLITACLLLADDRAVVAQTTTTTTDCVLPPAPPPVADPCANTLLCSSDAVCENRGTSHVCRCPIGYTYHVALQKCVDVDECLLSLDDCAKAGAKCTNTVGSYTCQCEPFYVGDGHYCESVGVTGCQPACGARSFCAHFSVEFYGKTYVRQQCLCQVGFKKSDSNECEDISECSNSPCDTNAACSELSPLFTCTCNAGYEGNGRYCKDVNECALNTHNCDENALCTNTEGGFTCTCVHPYAGDGVSCARICPKSACELFYEEIPPAEDVNECVVSPCGSHAVCENTDGSFKCNCDVGYSVDGAGITCVDVDECTNNTGHDCDPSGANCANRAGSFACTCTALYTGDGTYCAKKSDCSKVCPVNEYCELFIGTIHLCQCINGYARSAGTPGICVGIDECIENEPCHEKATCTDLTPSFRCECLPGYEGNGVHCQDVNECSLGGVADCDANALCWNTNGSFTCVCKHGYSGDGQTCVELCPPQASETTVPQIAPAIDFCASVPCLNDGTCATTDTGFTCTCAPAFFGATCDQAERSHLYPFGASQNDAVVCGTGDEVVTGIPLPQGLQFMCTRHRVLNVDINGFVTLGSVPVFDTFVPKALSLLPAGVSMVAPLWADSTSKARCDTGESVAYYGVYARDAPLAPVSDHARRVLFLAREDVRLFAADDAAFVPSLVVVVTWYKTIKFPIEFNEPKNERLTFQLVFVSDQSRYRTYVFFIYGDLTWSAARSTNVGYVTPGGPGADRTVLENLWGAADRALSLDDLPGNTGELGRWMYRLTTPACEEPNSAEYRCRQWAASQKDLSVAAASLPPCPCTWSRALSFAAHFILQLRRRCLLSMPLEGSTVAQECCYDDVSGALLAAEKLESGSLLSFHPSVDLRNYLDHDVNPKIACCQLSDNCDVFYRHRRPLPGCT